MRKRPCVYAGRGESALRGGLCAVGGPRAKRSIAVHLAVKEVLTMNELKARGRQGNAMHCAVCHQDNGKGIGPFQAIDGGAVASGPLDAHLKQVLQGKGQRPPWAHTLNDLEIAAVTTYQRNAWNNQTGEIVQPAQVSALQIGRAHV